MANNVDILCVVCERSLRRFERGERGGGEVARPLIPGQRPQFPSASASRLRLGQGRIDSVLGGMEVE